jgi:signal transduction histidine kinase
VRFHREERGDRTWFCVTDNGAGFDMAHAGRLFEPFSRLHRQDEFAGNGLGLATVRRILRRHGGDIEAESAVNLGARFRFWLKSQPQD